MATNTPDVLASIRTLPLAAEAQGLFSRAVRIVQQRPGDFALVAAWLGKHYSEATLRKLCERQYRHGFAFRLWLLRRDSMTYNRRLAIQKGRKWEELAWDTINDALHRGQRWTGEALVGRQREHWEGTISVDETNVEGVWRCQDEQYRRRFREIQAERRTAKLSEHDHPESPVWRLRRAVNELIDAEYPDGEEHAEHSRKIVALAAMLMPEPLPMLGGLGACAFASELDLTATRTGDLLVDELSADAARASRGPHGYRPTMADARKAGREEVLFERMPGETRKVRDDFSLTRLLELLRVAADELARSDGRGMDMDKAYIFCRFWPAFTEGFPYEQFNDLDESRLVGALWERADAEEPSDEAIKEDLLASQRRAVRGSPADSGPRVKQSPPPKREMTPGIKDWLARRANQKGTPTPSHRDMDVDMLVRKLQWLGWVSSPVMWKSDFAKRHIVAIAPTLATAETVRKALDQKYKTDPKNPRFGVIAAATLPREQELLFEQEAAQNRIAAQDRTNNAPLFDVTRCAIDLLARAYLPEPTVVPPADAAPSPGAGAAAEPAKAEATDASSGNAKAQHAEQPDPDIGLSPSRIKAKAAYDWAMQTIDGAGKMTVAQLYEAIDFKLDEEISQARGDEAARLRGLRDSLPPNAQAFGVYLRQAGVRRYDKAGKRRLSRNVRRTDDI